MHTGLENDTVALYNIIEDGFPIHSIMHKDKTLLCVAINVGNIDIVQLLLLHAEIRIKYKAFCLFFKIHYKVNKNTYKICLLY